MPILYATHIKTVYATSTENRVQFLSIHTHKREQFKYYSLTNFPLKSFNVFSNNIPSTNKTGNAMAANIPFLKSLDCILDRYPTNVGPPEQPKSPARASSANIAVPPFRMDADALLKLPGHIIPTDKPQIAHPTSDKKGVGAKEIQR